MSYYVAECHRLTQENRILTKKVKDLEEEVAMLRGLTIPKSTGVSYDSASKCPEEILFNVSTYVEFITNGDEVVLVYNYDDDVKKDEFEFITSVDELYDWTDFWGVNNEKAEEFYDLTLGTNSEFSFDDFLLFMRKELSAISDNFLY